ASSIAAARRQSAAPPERTRHRHRSGHANGQLSHAFDPGLHDVAASYRADARRGAREDHVAAAEFEMVRKEADHLRYLPDHLGEIPFLPDVAVHPERDLSSIRMADLAGGDDGTRRSGALERLADLPRAGEPLRLGLEVAA